MSVGERVAHTDREMEEKVVRESHLLMSLQGPGLLHLYSLENHHKKETFFIRIFGSREQRSHETLDDSVLFRNLDLNICP